MASYNLIATTTVGSGGAASIVFSGIPQTYTDLKIVTSMRSNYSGIQDDCVLEFNGLTTNLSSRWIQGSGTAASSGSHATLIDTLINANTSDANIFSNTEFYIPNYTGSAYKSVSVDNVTERNSATIYIRILAGLWQSTAAITSIKIAPYTGTLMQYSSASLYGIKSN